jgi:probable biosynthetic protein (TIGR04099 family)
MYGLLHHDVVVSLEQARSRGSAASRSEARSTAAILLGMPHLTGNGLSENWLLRELGHRHGLLLAELAGMSTPRFCDRRGNPVYSIFCAVSIEDGDFRRAEDNRVLQIASSLARISPAQFQSTHRLAIDGFAIGSVSMVSTFVSRTAGCNPAIARASVEGLPPVDRAAAPSGLAKLAIELCAGRIDSHMGFNPRVEQAVCSVGFDPCPSVDFNSAGFMYFASLIAMIDRAESRLDLDAAARATTRDRDVFFSGAIVRSERIEVRLLGWRREPCQIVHHFRMIRGSDGCAIADVFSGRVLAAH